MRHDGVVLAYVSEDQSEAQFRALKYNSVAGLLLSDDDGFIYAWRIGSVYRDGTTPDKLQAGCRLTFEVDARDPGFVTALSFKDVKGAR